MNKNFDVSIIMGSDSDLPIMKDCAKFLDDMEISYDIKICSVHRTPEKAMEYAKQLNENNVKVIIAGAGGAAHLPGVFAAMCPTILYSIVQMPSGIPVATVAINGAKNAGILATSILSIGNENLKKKLCEYKNSLKKSVVEKDEKLHNIGINAYLEGMKK